MNKKYMVIRKEHTYRDKLYEYTVPQLPELEAYTNITGNIEQAIWYVKYKNSCKLEQTNCLPMWKRCIPIVNIFLNNVIWRDSMILFLMKSTQVMWDLSQSIFLWKKKNLFLFKILGEDEWASIVDGLRQRIESCDDNGQKNKYCALCGMKVNCKL